MPPEWIWFEWLEKPVKIDFNCRYYPFINITNYPFFFLILPKISKILVFPYFGKVGRTIYTPKCCWFPRNSYSFIQMKLQKFNEEFLFSLISSHYISYYTEIRRFKTEFQNLLHKRNHKQNILAKNVHNWVTQKFS